MTENTEITAEKLEEIRQRYRPTEVPKCHICGAEMTIQCMSASRITYGCTGAIYDETGCHYAEGRSLADDHYAESRITVVDVSDPDVLAMVEALEKAQQRNAKLESSGTAPGILRCTECSYVLTKNIISVTADTITTVKSEPEPCPNGCGPLQPVTWKALAIQLMATTKQGVSDLLEANRRIAELEPIRAAAEKLVRCKGRYHSEQNYRALAALFGVTTPDLPPLEHENVNYADAAEMEIAALRQRIAELESRTVKLPKPISVLHRREFTEAHCAIYAYPEAEVNAALDDTGIKWEAD